MGRIAGRVDDARRIEIGAEPVFGGPAQPALRIDRPGQVIVQIAALRHAAQEGEPLGAVRRQAREILCSAAFGWGGCDGRSARAGRLGAAGQAGEQQENPEPAAR